jgi:flagellar capping protein FliD
MVGHARRPPTSRTDALHHFRTRVRTGAPTDSGEERNKQITRLEERLKIKEKQLRQEFGRLQEALSRIQSQQAFLNSFLQRFSL